MCKNPDSGENAVVITKGNVSGSKAVYSCIAGYYQLKGVDVRTCNDGKWSGIAPICSTGKV